MKLHDADTGGQAALRRPRWRPGITAGAALLALILIACEVAGWPFLRGSGERALAKATQRDVALGPGFRVHFIGPLRVRTDALHIGPPSWDAARTEPSTFVDANNVDVEIGWGSLWRAYRDANAPLHFNAIDAGDVRVRLRRESSGRANWAMAPAGDAEAKTHAKTTATPPPDIDRLVVKSGHVVLNDAMSGMDVDARVRTDEGSEPQPAQTGSGAPARGLVVSGSGSYRGNPLTFHIESDGALPLLATDASQGRVRLAFDVQAGPSRVHFTGHAFDVFHLAGVDGDYRVEGPSLATIGEAIGVTLPTTARFAIEGHLNKKGRVYGTDVRLLSVGTSRLDGKFNFDTAAAPPMLSGQLNGHLALADLAPTIGGGSTAAPANPPPPSGKVLPQKEFDIPSLRAMDAKVAFRLTQADFGTELLRPFAPLDTTLVLRGGVLTLDDIVARTSDGELRGMIQLDSRTQTPRFDTDLRWAGVELDQWIRAGNATDKKAREGAKPQPYITGNVLGTARLKGEGSSTAAILSTLQGTVSTGVQNGSLSHLLIEAAGLDLAQAIGVVVEGDQPLPMDCALVHLTADKGVLTTDLGIIDTPVTTLLLAGKVSLADESLGMTLTAKPKNVSPVTLRAPIHVTGTFANPSVLPEVKTVSLKLLAAAVLATVNPFAAVLPLVDLGDKSGAGGCQRAIAVLSNTAAQVEGKSAH